MVSRGRRVGGSGAWPELRVTHLVFLSFLALLRQMSLLRRASHVSGHLGQANDMSFFMPKQKRNRTATELPRPVKTCDDEARDKEKPKIAIFFNTFSHAESATYAASIISSQLMLVNRQPLLDGAPLFYTRVGDLTWDWPCAQCRGGRNATRPRACTQIAAVPEGDEVITLQALHDYCRAPDHREHRVIYMHSKGSFTRKLQNNVLRHALMRGILSAECISGAPFGAADARRCDACSSQFAFLPFFSFLGNMWLAECEFIAKLIAPDRFDARKRRVVETMKTRTRNVTEQSTYGTKYAVTTLDNRTSYRFPRHEIFWIERASWMGVGRYAMEHWIASHPDLRPCEVFSRSSGNKHIEYDRIVRPWQFRPPTLTRVQETMTANASAAFWRFERGVYHPWFGPMGRMFEYEQLYGKVPRNGSWIHTYWGGHPVN